jgi:hypothetical protein
MVLVSCMGLLDWKLAVKLTKKTASVWEAKEKEIYSRSFGIKTKLRRACVCHQEISWPKWREQPRFYRVITVKRGYRVLETVKCAFS